MRVPPSGHAFSLLLAASLTIAGRAQPGLTAQTRGGGGTSTSRVASPTVLASWTSQWNNSDGTTVTLLVLWRGTSGWFATGQGGGSRSGGGGGPDGTYRAYQTVAAGGRTFEMELDLGRKVVKILDQEISLQTANVILVDDADSAGGARIVGSRWVDPAPEGQSAGPDAIADMVRRTPALFEYLQCDLVPDDPFMTKMMPIICDQMRP
jgi:hypothetical protein